MKLIKYIVNALLLCAIPAVGLGQTVTCSDCTHDVSYFKGDGGLIATADGAVMVTYVASCGGVTRNGELAAGANGMVSMLFNADNGLGCHMDGGSLQIGPVMDGGWFWITDDTNSAVGSMVNRDVMGNMTTDPTDPSSDDITLTMGNGATFVKQASTGRVGILPTILPQPLVDPPNTCGPVWNSRTETYEQNNTDCVLGDGETVIELIRPGPYGSPQTITSPILTRDASGSGYQVRMKLWGNGSGHISTDGSAPTLGWRLEDVDTPFAVPQWAIVPAPSSPPGTTLAGVTNNNDGTFRISPSAEYCSEDRSVPLTIFVAAQVLPASNAVVPGIKIGEQAIASFLNLRIVCPPVATGSGRELVPENPFPEDQ